MSRVFLLSPARLDGKRAQMLFEPVTMFPIAKALREPGGEEIGTVFAFVSGLYFRGKLAYAKAFAHRAYVMTHNQGLVPLETRVTLNRLRSFQGTDIHQADDGFRKPLLRDATKLTADEVVLLGSIATKKYVDPLLEVFGERLLFPLD